MKGKISGFKIYGRMLGFLKPHLPLFIIAILLSFIVVALDALLVWIPASLVRTLFQPEVAVPVKPEVTLSNLNELLKYWTWKTMSARDGLSNLKFFCLFMVVVTLSKNICLYTQSLLITKLNLNVIRDMRDKVYSHLLRLPVSFFDRSRTGDIMSKVFNDVSMINTAISATLSKLLVEPLRLLAFIVLLFVISTKMTLLVLLVYPVLIFLILRIGKAVRRRSARSLAKLSGVVSVLSEALVGIRVVKMFNMAEVESKRFARENNAYATTSFRSTVVGALSSPLTETLGVLVSATLLWYGGQMVLGGSGTFSAEDFLRFLILLLSSYRPLKVLGGVNNDMQSGFAAADRVFEILDSEPEPLVVRDVRKVPSFEREIRFKDVNFHYPGSQEQVLHEVSFTLEKGKVVALVGASGSGKSTIMDCTPRFYDVTGGEILLDGKNIKEFDLVGYRHLFGSVAQETVLFNDTIHANIAYGLASATREKVLEVAEIAQVWEFAKRLPNGIDTVVGERGVALSGGERQRIAIARALLLDPPILLLDEATSSLDTESERLVQSAIDSLMKDRTTLVVAHRLSTIQHAHTILVLDRGRIVERGTHEELLAINKRYRYLYDLQFAPRRAGMQDDKA